MASPHHPVFALSDRFVDRYAALHPVDATLVGVPGHDHEWGDLGPGGIEATQDLLRATRQELAALPAPDDRWSALAVRVLTEDVDESLEAIEQGDPYRDLAHVGSTPCAMRSALLTQDASTPAGRDAVASRLERMPSALAGWRDTVDLGRRRGVLASRRQAVSVADQLRSAVGPKGAFTRRVAELAALDPGSQERLDAALDGARRACLDTAAWIEQVYLPDAPGEDAVGSERYARMARRYLGTGIDPDDATSWAWDQTAKLWERAEAAAGRIDPDAPLADVVRRLKVDPAFAAPDRDTFLALMQERQAEAVEILADRHFAIPEGIREVEIRLASPGAPLGAWYIGPSEDLSRPGTIWWSFGDRQVVPLYEEVSTAYHEGFPGHHLQVGTQVTLADRLSRAHRTLIWRPGYGEGWALYAEQLMDELGYLERPEYELGYLTGSLLRAVRVVLDLGLHLGLRAPEHAPIHPGAVWTYELAVDALEQLCFLDRDYAESEVTRYLGLPGQAISYAIGQRELLQLREERRFREQEAFDLRAFHADVLGSGPVGLDHLRELVLDPPVGQQRPIS